MISSFEAKNFRAFREASLTGLKTINILVGRSASGKTALLEGMRLALAGTPQVAWQMNAMRGVPVVYALNPSKIQFETMWDTLFYDFRVSIPIELGAIDSFGKKATVKIYFDQEHPVTPIIPDQFGYPAGAPNTIIPIVFERLSFSGETSTLVGSIHTQQQGQLYLQQGPELGVSADFYPAAWQTNAQQIATWYSQLSVGQHVADIMKVVKSHFTEILDIATEAPFGPASLYATIEHKSKKLPLALLSSGINKFVAILLAIRTYKDGVIIIDEIENGIWYKMFPTFWQAIHGFASENNTQVFASTHSLECLKALAPVIDEHPGDFTLIQLAQERGQGVARLASGKDAAAAIESDIELRR
jgi:hypothetical protein